VAAGGLSTASIGAQLGGLLGETKIGQIQLGDDRLDLLLSYPAGKLPSTVEGLSDLRVVGSRGVVRLGDVATITSGVTPGAIRRLGGNRYATVQVATTEGTDSAAVQKQVTDWAKQRLGEYGLRDDALENKGEQNDIVTSFGQLFLALGLSLVLTYFIFVLFFRSWLQPLIITFAVPLGFIGVFPALWLIGSQFGFLEILGMITLVSIVENVGTFVIDYANRKQQKGVDRKEAISIATAVRFRPIFLTKVTALGALLPLAILSPFWRGLSSVIIAGILTSGVLSLFTTPILYSWFDWWSRLPGRVTNRRRKAPTLEV
jgi:hydrophobic/amphiphilic exporter-1 (mainly G- bacteria), HAE1 family